MEWAQNHKNHSPSEKATQSLETNRTPWQCFQHYQNSLNGKQNIRSWTVEEDELLSKYIAAHGPQYVFNISNAEDIPRRFFPDRSSKHYMCKVIIHLWTRILWLGPKTRITNENWIKRRTNFDVITNFFPSVEVVNFFTVGSDILLHIFR